MFVDHVKIRIKSGNGGSGCVSFRREKHVAKGGPNGGDGGTGGDILFSATANMATLLDFRYRPTFKAGNAEHGKGSNKHGKNGAHLTVNVPIGTVVKDVETGDLIGDLTENGQELLILKGGRGGKGNARFASSTNRAPREWQQGEFGLERELELELKLIADVGLVGLPNAGKSTLISKISAAKPKIADYPFTTLQPNLGIVRYYDIGSFVVADIPGIVEGAHTGKGLGHEFLRHIERSGVLLVLVEALSEDVLADYHMLFNELDKYDSDLPKRISALLITKSDLLGEEVERKFTVSKVPYFYVSSMTSEGLPALIEFLWRRLQEQKSDES